MEHRWRLQNAWKTYATDRNYSIHRPALKYSLTISATMKTDISIRFNRGQLLRGHPINPEDVADLCDWFPVMVQEDSISWRHLPVRFTEPFFVDTLQQQALSERKVCVTPVDWLARIEPALTPSAFIFHTSRCGSTLLTQLLAMLDNCIVLSEPPVIDAFLYCHSHALHDDIIIERLRQLILALGQRRDSKETHFFIKLDSWLIEYLPLFRKAFPETPCWFLYREPDAILASHHRKRGLQMVPGIVMPMEFNGEPSAPGDLDHYCAQVLIRFFEHALKYENHLRCMHYRELPNIIWEKLGPEVNLDCDRRTIQAIQQRAAFHAKDVTNPFHGDMPTPLHNKHPALYESLQCLYTKLEKCRSDAISNNR